MSKTMYRTEWAINPKITPVTVEGETNSFVIINGRKNKKTTEYQSYFDTYEDAANYLIKSAYAQVKFEQGRLSHAEDRLQQALSLLQQEGE